MPLRINDRYLWLGFGVFFFLAAHGMRYAIKDSLRSTDPLPDPPRKIDQNEELPEDNIPLDVLKTLSESPDYNISNAAINIVVSRFLRQPNAYRAILKDTESQDDTTRARAHQALTFLRQWPLMSPHLENRGGFPSPPRSGASSPSIIEVEDTDDLSALQASGSAQSSGEPFPVGGVIVPSVEDPVAGWTSVPRERPTGSEAERRRNRREAMVFREGEGGVEEDDIIRPVSIG